MVCGDWHLGLESARLAIFPRSRRQGCFPHLIGATTRPAVWEESEGGSKQKMHRSGIFQKLREALDDSSHLDVVQKLVYYTRSCSRGVFSMLWSSMLQDLRQSEELQAIHLLTERYLNRALAE